MKTPKYNAAWTSPRKILALILTTLVFSIGLPAQPPANPVPAPENILSGALVIPMDNVNQGNAAGTTFNLRAYGLVNLFLQNNIPVKWVILPGKAKDAVDFSANVTRIAGTQGTAGPASVSFSGGPFVVSREFDTPALRALITSFNGGTGDVTVYKTNADVSANVRYNMTHKPKIAIGPDGGNFGSGVHQSIFDAAGIPNYTSNVGDIGNQGACFTLATQAHSTNATFVNTYRQFVQSGGNLLLQCASVNTFENDANGRFQASAPGYFIYSSNNPPNNEINSNAFAFPAGSMPFNQFIGLLADQDGAVTEYAYSAGSGPVNNNTVSVVNTGANSDKFVATASQIGGPVGGVVFELGGHNYARDDDGVETDSEIAKLNGQRMLLNAAMVPAGTVCTAPPQAVTGYKSVRRINVRQGGPPVAPGDTLEWTIDYVNNSQANQFDFQVRDIVGDLSGFLTLVPNSNVVTLLQGGATALRNPAYDGAGDDATADMLAAGAFLPVGGRIQLKVQTTINANVPRPYVLLNQTKARSQTILPTDNTKSDAVDATNTSVFADNPPPAGSVPQIQNLNIIDPTAAPVAPTAASVGVEGRAVTADGIGIPRALVIVTNASTGEVRSARTNSTGFFRVDELEAGGLYLITVRHKRYAFPTEPLTLTITEDAVGLTFTGTLPEAKAVVNTKTKK
ncbi:MAG: carboxypeptidase regulatory-like domain-containing protein [Acidobacteria bacterium]|nr:carboxypeptidase regulatory-like domain-containing protein [Acidobacteriota bacterium]